MNVDMRQLIASHRGAVVQPTQRGTDSAAGKTAAVAGSNSVEFSALLRSHIDEIRFSAHAATRMKSRNIEMTPEMMSKLEKAMHGAADKGARDSLILLKDYAFIVNIPNRTVVTAMDGTSMKENIFTNIDSAVVAD
jgi:flagellar operon protein